MPYKDPGARRESARKSYLRKKALAELKEPEPERTEEVPRPGAQKPVARRKREKPNTSNTVTAHADKRVPPVGDKKCGARKADGSTCELAAGWNTDHPGYGPCSHHFGSTPGGRKGAATDMAEELMVFYGEPLDTNPIDALLDEVRRTAGHIAWLGDRIGKMHAPLMEQLYAENGDPRIGPDGKPLYKTAAIPPEVDGWLKNYQSERAHLVRTASACLNAGVNERLVQIAEHQGARLADAVETILAQLGLTDIQQAMVPVVVPNVLRQLNSGQPLILEGVLEDDH